MVVIEGSAVSYERGTPVDLTKTGPSVRNGTMSAQRFTTYRSWKTQAKPFFWCLFGCRRGDPQNHAPQGYLFSVGVEKQAGGGSKLNNCEREGLELTDVF